MHIYSSNFVCRNRTVIYFFNFFNNDVFSDNANQFILTCGTQIKKTSPTSFSNRERMGS